MELPSLLRSTDYFRRSPSRSGASRGHKEWLHFCVSQGDVDVLVNFSVSDDVEPGAGPAAERGHVIALVHSSGRWQGDVDRYWDSEIDVAGGEVRARMGESAVHLSPQGTFHVRAKLRRQRVEVDLELRPETFPSYSNNVRLCRDQSLNWLVVPRLRASGVVRVARDAVQLHDAVAYHDHNWGTFAWGADFAWEWGYGSPSDPGCPWSFLFVRLSNRAMSSTRTMALTLWRGRTIVRSFRGREVSVSDDGGFVRKTPFKIPAVMGLLSPGLATEVPARIAVDASADGDTFRVVMTPRAVAQIIVPNDRSPAVTIVNEAAARLVVSGRVLGEEISYEGRGMLEVLAS